jgi:hypothetical protein
VQWFTIRTIKRFNTKTCRVDGLNAAAETWRELREAFTNLQFGSCLISLMTSSAPNVDHETARYFVRCLSRSTGNDEE